MSHTNMAGRIVKSEKQAKYSDDPKMSCQGLDTTHCRSGACSSLGRIWRASRQSSYWPKIHLFARPHPAAAQAPKGRAKQPPRLTLVKHVAITQFNLSTTPYSHST